MLNTFFKQLDHLKITLSAYSNRYCCVTRRDLKIRPKSNFYDLYIKIQLLINDI